MIARWTKTCIRYRWMVVVLWAVLVLTTLPFARDITRHLTSSGFDNPASSATWATNQVATLHPAPTPNPLLIQGLPPTEVQKVAASLSISAAALHPTGEKNTLFLPSPGYTPSEEAKFQEALRGRGGSSTPVSQTAIGNRIKQESSSTLAASGLLAMPFLAVLLLFVFGSVLAVALPLAIALAGSELALAVISIVAAHLSLSVFLTDIVSFLALGVGIDYALFISTRFRQNVETRRTRDDAVLDAMSHAGRSVLYSGIAVALAVATLLLGDNAYWRGLALGGSVAIFAVLLATHSLLPAILHLLGPRLYWGRVPKLDWKVWQKGARWVAHGPIWALFIGLVLLVPFARYAPQITMSTPANLASMLPASSPLRQAVAKQQEVQGAGSIAPLAVVVEFPTPLTSTQNWNDVAKLASHLRGLPDVSRVLTPTDVGVSTAQLAAAMSHPDVLPASLKSGLEQFLSFQNPRLVVLYVTADTGPDTPQTVSLSQSIDRQLPRWLPPGSRAAAGGLVPLLHSFNSLTRSRLPWIIGAALVVALVVLTWATGSLMQAMIGVVFDGLVGLATAGFLALVVTHGLFGFERQPLDSSITPLIFVLLFGLSMDYEVILLHRIQEPLRQGLTTRDAVERGLATTGSMVTGAGMIMVVVFLALLISPLQVMKTVAVGLSFAVLADTWVVRSLLIPSTSVLLGRLSFWPWRPRPSSV